MKKMYLNAAGGLLAGLLLFSCSTEELVTEQTINSPNQFNDISEIDNDKIIADILSKNTEVLNPDYNSSGVNEDGLLTGKNTSNLTLLIDQYCGRTIRGEDGCATSIYELGGFSLDNLRAIDSFTGWPFTNGTGAYYSWSISNPYTASGSGVYLSTTDYELASYMRINFIDYVSNDDFFNFYRHEISAKTNAVINIETTDNFDWIPTQQSSTPRTITLSENDTYIDAYSNVNVFLKNFNTDETVMIIAQNIENPQWNFLEIGFSWRIPNTVPTGEYYIEIQDVTDSAVKNHEHYTTKLLIENTEQPEFVNDFIPNVITSPIGIYNYNLGVNRGEITVEWDRDVFEEEFVNITMSSIDFTTFPMILVENHSAWTRNNGTYIIPADSYGAFASGFLTIQSTTTSTGTSFSIQN